MNKNIELPSQKAFRALSIHRCFMLLATGAAAVLPYAGQVHAKDKEKADAPTAVARPVKVKATPAVIDAVAADGKNTPASKSTAQRAGSTPVCVGDFAPSTNMTVPVGKSGQ